MAVRHANHHTKQMEISNNINKNFILQVLPIFVLQKLLKSLKTEIDHVVVTWIAGKYANNIL